MGKAGKDSSVHRSDDCGRAGEQTENANGQGRAVTTAERAWADAPRERIEALQEQLAAHQVGVVATETIRQAGAMVDNLREAHAGEVSALKTGRHRLATQIDVSRRSGRGSHRCLRARVDVLQRERNTARAAGEGLLARLRAALRGQ
jgi:hypothetical protein